jgi:hypothetical protein
MIKLMGSSLALTVVLFSGQALAEDFGMHHHKHTATIKHHQDQRINQGIRSGELTGQEVRKLRRDRNELRHHAYEYKRDGVLTEEERRNLRRERREYSREIYEQTHDEERRK